MKSKTSSDASIADSNGPLLRSMLDALHLSSTHDHCQDDIEHLSTMIQQCSAQIIVSTGSVSKGDVDIVPAVAQRCGFTLLFHGISMQPGKPVMLAQHPNGQLWLGLPGNPVSVVATSHILLCRLIGRFAAHWQLPTWQLPLTHATANRKTRDQFLPARLVAGGIEVIPWNGSGDLLAAAAGDGLVHLPAQTDWQRGDLMTVTPYLDGIAGERGNLFR